MRHPFSPAEMRIIRELRPHWVELIESGHWSQSVPRTLGMLAEYCFTYSIQGPAVEAFRNAFRAFDEGKVTRNSAEYEQLLNY